MDASFGSHPLFELLKCGRRLLNRPRVLGSVLRMAGYLWWQLVRRHPLLEPDRVDFIRRDQLTRIRRWGADLTLSRPRH
jgi:hypothetical protein